MIRIVVIFGALLLSLTAICQGSAKNIDSLRNVYRLEPNNIKVRGQIFEYWRKKQPDSASAFAKTLLMRGERENDSLLMAESCAYRGGIATDQNKFTDGIAFYKRGLSYCDRRTDSAGLVLK